MPARFFSAAALREAPMPTACTRSTRSVAMRLASVRALRVVAIGLEVSVTNRTHSPAGICPSAGPMTHSCLNFLNCGTASSERRIAIRRDEGAGPGLFWLGGFKSDMKGTKAEALSEWARQNGRACVRFDYSGHGE